MNSFRLISWVGLLVLAGCSSLNPFASDNLEPADLEVFEAQLQVQTSWQADVGDSEEGVFQPSALDDLLFVASADGDVVALNRDTGERAWEAKLEQGLVAGVGVAADTVAVVDTRNTLIAFDFEGNTKWTVPLPTDVTTVPSGVSGVILVRAIDYSVSAYSAQSGGLVWRYQRQLPSLTLRAQAPISTHNGVVYAGFPGGRVVGLNITTGVLVWEGALRFASGTTEIERIADVTGAPVYNFREVCAGSFQGSVGCLTAQTGQLNWSSPFSAPNGVSVDERYLIAQDESGALHAFSRANGKKLWISRKLLRRQPTTPVRLGRSVALGDYKGYLHFLNRDDGNVIARLRVGGSELTSAPVRLSETQLATQTRDGQLRVLVIQN